MVSAILFVLGTLLHGLFSYSLITHYTGSYDFHFQTIKRSGYVERKSMHDQKGLLQRPAFLKIKYSF